MKAKVIAIDGPAASGKSTIANRVAAFLDIPYINTGNMYRAITWALQQRGVAPTPENSIAIAAVLDSLTLEYRPDGKVGYELYLNNLPVDNAIRSPEVTALVSSTAALPEVRAWLLQKQRDYTRLGLLVMEGRDIGTVVFPNAEFKFFLTASPEARARRRLAQSGETPENATVQSVAAAIAERDRIDSNRAVAPLKQAVDATLIDSTDLSIDQVLEIIVTRVRNATH